MLPLLCALGLVAVHIFTPHLRWLDGTPRSRWLSAAGGISLAYVFLHFLPELAHGQELLNESELAGLPVEFELFAVALIGLLLCYGLERYVQMRALRARESGQQPGEQHGLFWVHIGNFTLYNIITGYLLVHRGADVEGALSTIIFALAMAVHFMVTDWGLKEAFADGYRRVGRFVLSAAVLAGLAAGFTLHLPELAILIIIALLGGAVTLNVLKEELPEERESRFGALVAGAAGYALLLGFMS